MHALRCLLLIALYAAVFLLIAGCGGGGTSDTLETSSVEMRLFFDGPFLPGNALHRYDPGEAAPAGIPVELTDDDGIVTTVLTDLKGLARISGLTPGAIYTIRVPLDSIALQNAALAHFGVGGWFLASAHIGDDDTVDSDATLVILDNKGYASIKFQAPPAGEVVGDLGVGFVEVLV